MSVEWQLKDSHQVCKDQDCRSKNNNDSLLRMHDKKALECESDTRCKSIRPAQFLTVWISVDAVVEYGSAKKEQSQEHESKNEVTQEVRSHYPFVRVLICCLLYFTMVIFYQNKPFIKR